MKLFWIIVCSILQAYISSCLANTSTELSILNIIKESSITNSGTTLDNAKHSVVSLRIKDSAKNSDLRLAKTKKYGSGVLVAKNLVLTNNHVIGSKIELDSTIALIDHISTKSDVPSQLKELRIKKVDGIFYTNETYDFTFFEIEPVPDLSNGQMRPIPRWKDELDQYGNKFISISNPMGQVSYTSDLCDRQDNQEVLGLHRKSNRDEYAFYNLCETYPGSSGSPIFDNNGYLLGIHRMTHYDPSSDYIAEFNESVFFPFILKTLVKNIENNNPNKLTTLNLKSKVEASNPEFGIESVLLGIPPGHEDLTSESVKRIFFEFPELKSLEYSMVDGNVSIDYPTYYGSGPSQSQLEKLISKAKMHIPDLVEMYQSHFGNNAYRHAMLTSDEFNVKSDINEKTIRLHERIINYLINQVDKFIEMDKIDRQEGAREFGRLLHTIQDSYSLAHTKRDNSGISEFYFYEDSDHDKKLHKQLDLVRNPSNGLFTKEAESAIHASIKLLKAAYSKEEKEEIKKNLLNIISDIFKLSSKVIANSSFSTSSNNVVNKFINTSKNQKIKDNDILYMDGKLPKTILSSNESVVVEPFDESTLGTKWPPGGGETIKKSLLHSDTNSMPVKWPPGQSD